MRRLLPQLLLQLELLYNRRLPDRKRRFVLTRVSRFLVRQMGCLPPRLSCADGIQINLSPEIALDLLVRDLMFRGTFEKRQVELIRTFLAPGDTFIDVGANIGYFSIVAARRVGSEGQVIAFEPDPVTYAVLKDNLGLNGCNNCEAVNQGCFSYSGKLVFHRQRDTGQSFIDERQGSGKNEVEVVALDEFPTSQPIHGRPFLKVDAEGADYRVLEGARDLLKKRRPVVMLELGNLSRFENSTRDLTALMDRLNYRCWSMQNDWSLDALCLPAEQEPPPSKIAALGLNPLQPHSAGNLDG